MLVIKYKTASVLDQFPESAPISCLGRPEIRLSGGANSLSEETLGKVLLKESCLELWPSAEEGDTAVLMVTELVRESDAILIIGYDKPDVTSRVKVINDKNVLDALSGGHGAEGSTTVSIVAWVRGHGGGQPVCGCGFLTYGHDDGFRQLSKEREHVSDLNATSEPADNVRVASDSGGLVYFGGRFPDLRLLGASARDLQGEIHPGDVQRHNSWPPISLFGAAPTPTNTEA